MALGRVLTLLIVVDEQDAEEAIEAANDASRQHPCRIIAVVIGNKRGQSRIDAQIRVGGDAGASEVVVLRLYGALTEHGRSVVIPLLLPDSPVVAWWPTDAPANVADDPIGSMAQRRITDAAEAKNPRAALKARAGHLHAGRHRPGLDAGHALARAARRRPRPAALRAGHRGDRHGWLGLPVDRPAGRLAGPDPALPGPPGPVAHRHRHGQRAARAPQRRHRPGPPRRLDRHPQPARAAGPPDLAGPAGHRGVPGRRAAPARPRRDLRGDHPQGAAAGSAPSP